MNARRRRHGWRDFLVHHSLSIVTIAVVLLLTALYRTSDPDTHLGSFFGNAVADWTGVLVTVVATKYFYEIGSAESRKPRRGGIHHRVLHALRNHSLSIFLLLSGAIWVGCYVRMDPQSKWGEVVGNIISEWTQQLGLVLMTKRLMEDRSKESRAGR